jgi:hypothetical protein
MHSGRWRRLPPARFAYIFTLDLSRRCREGGEQCRGPSLAFVPFGGTKDCAQDNSFAGGLGRNGLS